MRRQTLEFLLGVLFFITLLMQNALLIAFFAPPIMLYFVLKVWAIHGVRQVVVYITYPHHNFFPNEHVEIEVVIENRGWLPLTNLALHLAAPKGLRVLEPATAIDSMGNSMHLRLRMASFERVRVTLFCKLEHRGWYQFEKAVLKNSDVFGWHDIYEERKGISKERDRSGGQYDRYCIVYPEVKPLARWPVRFATPFGGQSTHSWLYQDPFNIVGLREYSQESVTDIDWKASARNDMLIVRQVHASFAPTAVVFLDVVTAEHFWEGIHTEAFEDGVRVAASVLNYLQQQGSPFALYTNGIIMEQRGRVQQLARGEGLEHLGEALTILSGVVPISLKTDLKALFEVARIDVGQSVFYVAAHLTVATQEMLVRLASHGHVVTVVWLGKPAQVPKLPRVPTVLMREVLSHESTR